MEIAMVGGKTMALAELDPAYLDRGTFFGDGVYEVVRSYDGKLFAVAEHMARFERSLEAIGIGPVDIAETERRVEQAFAASRLANCAVYFHVTRGSAKRDHTWSSEITPNFLLTVTELDDQSAVKASGVRVSTYPDWRWKRCDIKSLNLLANVLAKQDAKAKGCFEAILVSNEGTSTEGAGSTLFAVIDGGLVTRPLGPEILPSITRLVVLRIAARVGLPVDERALSPGQALAADELFLAVTTKDIVPIVEFDGQVVANGRPGPVTKELLATFAEEVRAEG